MNTLLQVGIILTAMDKMSGVLTGAADKAAQGFARLQQRVVRVGQALTEMGTKASLMGHGILAGLETPIKAFADLNEASTDLRVAMMDNLGQVPPQFAEITRQSVELGNVLKGNTADFTNAATALLENGTSIESITNGGLKAASYLGVILKQVPAQAAEMTAKFREAFGLADNELVKMADLTQRAKFAFGLNPEEIKYAAQYAGATLNNFKLSGIENTKMFLAMQGIARQRGTEGSVFGTNFATMMTQTAMLEQKLGRNSKVMKEVNSDLRNAGIHLQFFDSAGNFVGLEKMVGELEKLNVLSQQDKTAAMTKLFNEQGMRVATMLADSGVKGLHQAMDKMDKQADLMQRINAVNKSAKNTWEALTGTVTNFWAAVGGPMVTALYPLINKVNAFVGGQLMAWVDRNKDLVKWLGLAALATGVLLVALGGLGIVAGAVASGLAVVSGAVAAIFSPVTLVVAAIAGAALLVYKYWHPLKAFFVGFWKGFKEGLAPIQPALDWLRGAFDKVVEKAKAFWNWLSPSKYSAKQIYGIQQFGQGFGKAFGDAFEKVKQFGQGAFAKLGEWFKPVEPIFHRAKALFLDVAEGIGKFWGVLKDFGAGFAGGLWDGFKSGFAELQPIFDSVSSHVVPALQAVGAATKAFLDYGLSTGEKVWGIIKSILGGFDKGQEKTESFGRTVGKFTADIVLGIAKIGAKIASLFVNLAADMVSAGAKILTSLWEGMKSVSGNVLDWVGKFAGKVMEHFPQSPAKTGPFRDIPRIHIIESIAATMRPEPLVRAASAAAAAGLLALAPLANAHAVATMPVIPNPLSRLVVLPQTTPQPAPHPNVPLSAAMPTMPNPLSRLVAVSLPTPQPAPKLIAPAASRQGDGAAGPVTVHFAPQITIQGQAGPSSKDDIMAALKQHKHELVRLIQDVMARNARRQY